VLLLSGTALFSYAVFKQFQLQVGYSLASVELSQNLYFVGLVLTYILWAAVLKMRETRTRLIQSVLSMGVYFSLFAANFALQTFNQSRGASFEVLTPLFGCFLPYLGPILSGKFRKRLATVPSQLAVVPDDGRRHFHFLGRRFGCSFSFAYAAR